MLNNKRTVCIGSLPFIAKTTSVLPDVVNYYSDNTYTIHTVVDMNSLLRIRQSVI